MSSTQNAVRAGRRSSQTGMTLVELVVAFTILLILTTMAVPMTRYQIRRAREKELRYDLDDMRKAIDRYKDLCDKGRIQAQNDTYCYPPTLQLLVDGVKMTNTLGGGLNDSNDGKVRMLRRVPKDPMTGDKEWGMRSVQDSPDSTSWGGQDVFDVYSKTLDKASDGTPYSEW
ncbi:MAG TPA: type II secretion system protein [Bryobacteraceae bacterium]|nr:type II secretion system protein [Bryobacteraceae bacterium]